MEEEIEEGRSPLWYIVAIALLLILVMSSFPFWGLKDDSWPSSTPTIDEVYQSAPVVINKTSSREYVLMPNDPLVKQVATRIATYGCGSSTICQAKAEFFFVRDNFLYVAETDEYIQLPREMLSTRGGDCDDHAVLLANLLQGVGIPTRFVFVPGHVFVQAYIPDAPRRYKTDGWISLDATCKSCGFGDEPPQYRDSRRRYQ